MQTVLDRVSADDVSEDPFPHIAITDAVDDDLCQRLLAEFPPLDAFTGNGRVASNKRMGLSTAQVLDNPQISQLWQDFIGAHASQTFLSQLVEVFGNSIRRLYPSLEEGLGPLESLRSGIRKVDAPENSDVLLDAQISINTPVVGAPSSVRRAHLDDPDKLFAGLFYLRDPEDRSTGGDLEICRYRSRPRGFRGMEIYDRFVDVVKTVPYQRSALVMFVNSDHSLHGVTVRSQTEVPRRFVNLVATIDRPLFDVAPYQANVWDKVLASPELVGKRLKRVAVAG